MEKAKIIIIITTVLIFVIAITSIYLYTNRDKLFTSTYEFTYPDQCVEVFENDVLITEECILGRQMYEEQLNNNKNIKPMGMKEWKMNLNLT